MYNPANLTDTMIVSPRVCRIWGQTKNPACLSLPVCKRNGRSVKKTPTFRLLQGRRKPAHRLQKTALTSGKNGVFFVRQSINLNSNLMFELKESGGQIEEFGRYLHFFTFTHMNKIKVY